VPLGARYDYDQVRRFAEIVVQVVHKQLPDATSLVRSPVRRQGRVYLDWLQNGRGKTLAAPYCVRPVPGAMVSMPLSWAEVKGTLDPTRFTIRTAAKRIERLGDLWSPVLKRGIALERCLERLSKALAKQTL
jgi:bifunctional non-homologous end joining protein LigD